MGNIEEGIKYYVHDNEDKIIKDYKSLMYARKFIDKNKDHVLKDQAGQIVYAYTSETLVEEVAKVNVVEDVAVVEPVVEEVETTEEVKVKEETVSEDYDLWESMCRRQYIADKDLEDETTTTVTGAVAFKELSDPKHDITARECPCKRQKFCRIIRFFKKIFG